MNQRQKKKSSQQRKKHFDGLKAKEGRSSTPSQAQRQQPRDQGKPQQPSTPPQSIKVDKKEVSKIKESDYSNQEPEQKKSFSKRKIISNWAKYDEERLGEHDDTSSQRESEEELQARLIQLFNLPLTLTSPSLTDIGGDNFTNTTGEQLKENSNFLTLDCQALAESLSTLPLHIRLDIDPKLLLDEDEEEEGKMSTQTNLHSFRLTFPSAVPSGGSIASFSDGEALDLSKSLKRAAAAEKKATDDDRKIEFSSLQTLTQSSHTLAKQLPTGTSSSLDEKITTATHDEDEAKKLEILLSTKSELEAKTQHHEATKPITSLSLRQEEEKSSKFSTSAAMASTSLPPSTADVDEDTLELDDMLDDLLT